MLTELDWPKLMGNKSAVQFKIYLCVWMLTELDWPKLMGNKSAVQFKIYLCV